MLLHSALSGSDKLDRFTDTGAAGTAPPPTLLAAATGRGARGVAVRRRGAGGSPWAPSAAPSGTWTTNVGAAGGTTGGGGGSGGTTGFVGTPVEVDDDPFHALLLG